jgi:hypothetical protein
MPYHDSSRHREADYDAALPSFFCTEPAVQTSVNKSFTESKRRLSAAESQRVDDFILKWQRDPNSPSINLERVQGALDPELWSARVSQDLRVIMHRAGERCLLLFAGHHDDSYRWASRRRVRIHPVEGTLQIVHVPEIELVEPAAPTVVDKAPDGAVIDVDEVEERTTSAAGAVENQAGYDFRKLTDTQLLSLGVPTEWLDRVRLIRDENSLLELRDLPEEVWERLFRVAQKEEVAFPKPVQSPQDIGSSVENLRRIHVVTDADDLKAILSSSFEDWMVFLHPSQRSVVEGQFNGPLKITGVAGTGKTVVAMHRARQLAEAGARVLLTTYTRQLCKSLSGKLSRFCAPSDRSLIAVGTVHSHALRLLHRLRRSAEAISTDQVREVAESYLPTDLDGFDRKFVIEEWLHIVAEQGVTSSEEYKEAPRVGRGTPLTSAQRERLWAFYAPLLNQLQKHDRLPWSLICRQAREAIERKSLNSDYDAVIVDEVQDLSTQELRFLASLAGGEPKNLTLIGDAGQRIYSGGFSLRSMGIEVRGRSRTLKVNYRTTREIMQAAARLRDDDVDDLDEGHEGSSGVVDLLSGASPVMREFRQYDDETQFVGDEIAKLISEGVQPSEIAVFARNKRLRWWFEEALRKRGVPFTTPEMQRRPDAPQGGVVVNTMHGAKGLEFRFAFVVGCQQDQVPAPFAVEMAYDPEAKRRALKREKSLLYVCMTRARERLYVTWTGRKSRFLETPSP